MRAAPPPTPAIPRASPEGNALLVRACDRQCSDAALANRPHSGMSVRLGVEGWDARTGLQCDVEEIQERVRNEGRHVFDTSLHARLRLDLPCDNPAQLVRNLSTRLVSHGPNVVQRRPLSGISGRLTVSRLRLGGIL